MPPDLPISARAWWRCERYRRHLRRYLAAQATEQLTQRALLDTVEQVYGEAPDQLGAASSDASAAGVQRGRSDLTPCVLEAFDAFNRTLLEEVVQFNRGSCALSNFPDEHAPPSIT
jgi:monoamine oxidase